jgi:hypothetical protein
LGTAFNPNQAFFIATEPGHKAATLFVFAPSQILDSLQRLPFQAHQLQFRNKRNCTNQEQTAWFPCESFTTNPALFIVRKRRSVVYRKEGASTFEIQHGLITSFTRMARLLEPFNLTECSIRHCRLRKRKSGNKSITKRQAVS